MCDGGQVRVSVGASPRLPGATDERSKGGVEEGGARGRRQESDHSVRGGMVNKKVLRNTNEYSWNNEIGIQRSVIGHRIYFGSVLTDLCSLFY